MKIYDGGAFEPVLVDGRYEVTSGNVKWLIHESLVGWVVPGSNWIRDGSEVEINFKQDENILEINPLNAASDEYFYSKYTDKEVHPNEEIIFVDGGSNYLKTKDPVRVALAGFQIVSQETAFKILRECNDDDLTFSSRLELKKLIHETVGVHMNIEKDRIYLKTMSHNAEFDNAAADVIENFFKEKNVKHERFDGRRFYVYDAIQFVWWFVRDAD